MSASGHRKHDCASVCQPSFVTRTKKGPHVGIDKMRLMVSQDNKITSNKCAIYLFICFWNAALSAPGLEPDLSYLTRLKSVAS